LRTVTTLRDEGYSDISTQEVLVRTHDLAQPPGPALSSVTAIVERLQAHEARKEERRVLQMKTARERSAKIKEKEAKGLEEAGVQEKGNEKSSEEQANAAVGEKRSAEESEPTQSKKPRLDQSDKPSPRVRELSKIQHLQSLLATPPPTRSKPTWTEPEAYPSTTVLTKPSSEMRGHTSYLTFATLHPLSIRTEVAPLTKSRVDLLKEKDAEETTEGSEYGSEGLEEVMRTMTEEEMLSLAAV
jgi:tRNA (adenine57-N1/adenine58-N1)-methyltransferase